MKARFASVIFALLVVASVQAASTIDVTNNYAYAANLGWTNWRPDSDGTNTQGVVVNEFVCSGYVYGANVGWISLGNGSPANHIRYGNSSATDYGVNVTVDSTQPGVAVLRGYAYGANIGWINFEATGNPRISLFTGAFSGYAYSANCGWINLNTFDSGASPTQHYVQTDHILMGADTNSNGIADAWEYLYFGGLLAGGQENSSQNGNGMTLLQDYQDGVDPTLSNSGLRITAYSANAAHTSSNVTFTSTTARLYSIVRSSDLTLPLASWTDTGLGIFAPDAGTVTTRVVTFPAATKNFFRVKTMRPLP